VGVPVLGYPAFTKKLELTLLHLPAMRKDDRIGVERSAIMELHTFSQFESVGLAVRADGPRFRKTWFSVCGFVFVEDEAFMDMSQIMKEFPSVS